MQLKLLFAMLIVGAITTTARPPQEPSKRHTHCKTPANASMCYSTRGRITLGAGTPAYRMWKVGTKRLLGIYSGPSIDREHSLDNEDPEFPINVQRTWQTRIGRPLWGDFEICPLDLE